MKSYRILYLALVMIGAIFIGHPNVYLNAFGVVLLAGGAAAYGRSTCR